ncbi:small, acid-soluble spore protein, alpha/beta type [Clostridium sp. DJ247]|uniref:small, acid-soluble spore protein, alpha/beta type n=1 Tax=Clostridium sp. DJ247 TaxID=2726188 RepID=UPI001628AC1E|nr:small, acid-soluble spore protein, alpha/beta type [Clostridium sp. DJ247]MBC2578923.1 small, acid-soluble spore protein, alpha/beta type [Clostridium sp. DJ247]
MENSYNRILMTEGKMKLDKPKVESARDVGVILKVGNNGDITSRGNGSLEDKVSNLII